MLRLLSALPLYLPVLLALLFSPFFGTRALAQNDLAQGYEYLAANEPLKAIDFFKQQTKNQPSEANMALSYAYAMIGDGDGTINAYVNYYFNTDESPRRNALVDAVWTSPRSEMSKDQIRMLEDLLTSNYTRLAPLAHYSLATHYRLARESKLAAEHYAALGAVPNWQLLGPFENISESGYTKDFGAVAKPRPDATFTNKNGAKIQWFAADGLPETQWMRFDNHMGTRNAIMYAQTFTNSPIDQEAVFRLGTSGSVKVWVNDQLVFSEVTERDNHLDTYNFIAPLKRGANRILIQIGATDKTGANFLLRLTDDMGKLLPGLTHSSSYKDYPKAGGEYTPRVLPNPTLAYLDERIKSGKANMTDYMVRNHYYSNNGFLREARRSQNETLKVYPDQVYVMSDKASTLRRLGDDTGASALMERIKEIAPDNPVALTMEMEEASSRKDWAAFERDLNKYKKLYGESRFTFDKELQLVASKKEVEKMIGMIADGVKKFPGEADVILGQATVLTDYRKNPKGAIRMLETFNKEHFRTNVIEKLINLYLEQGNVDKVEKLFEDLLYHDSKETAYYSRLARLYTMQGNKREAQRMLDKALAIAPYSGNYYRSVASLYADMEEKDKAADWYQKAIALNPYDYESRDALRSLGAEEATTFDIFGEETDYYEIFANSKGPSAYPNDHSAILSYDVQQVVHEGGATETRTAIMIKALNEEAVDTWKEYEIPIYGQQSGVVDVVEVIAPDGSRHEATRSGTSVVFDGLQAGGAIHLVYRLKEFQYGRLAGKFWNSHPLALYFPMDRSSYSLITPAGMEFQTEITGELAPDIKTNKTRTSDGRDLYTWETLNTPGLDPEASMPAGDDVLTYIRVTNIKDWTFIADWYAELTYAKIRPDDVVRNTVDELFAGKEGLTEREEVQLIYEYVTNQIRYISVPFIQSGLIPQEASKTILTNQGDCKDVSSLFVAMCDLRGVDANLVLVNTRDQARAGLALPGIGFNHCIAKVDLEGQEYFVELTDENLPFGTGDWSVNGAFAVVIPREGENFSGQAGPINPKSRGVNAIHRTGTIKLEGDDLLATFDTRRQNSVTSNIRHLYKLESDENREKLMLETLSGRYPRIELTELKFANNLDGMSEELAYTFGYKATGVRQEIAGMSIYEIKLSDQLRGADYVTQEKRETPIDLWQTYDAEWYDQEITINAPAGKAIVELPKGTNIENEYIAFAMKYELDGSDVKVKRTLRLKKDVVPTKDYAAFREDMLKLMEAEKITLAFR